MKKILILTGLLLYSLPLFAACSITGGACTVGALPSNITPNSNLENIVPDNIRNMTKTNAFQHDYRQPYSNALINTRSQNQLQNSTNYNSNCQFGVCLPGGEFSPGAGEFGD